MFVKIMYFNYLSMFYSLNPFQGSMSTILREQKSFQSAMTLEIIFYFIICSSTF